MTLGHPSCLESRMLVLKLYTVVYIQRLRLDSFVRERPITFSSLGFTTRKCSVVGNILVTSVCVSVSPVWALSFECLYLQTSFWYADTFFTKPRSNFSIKVTGSKSRSYDHNSIHTRMASTETRFCSTSLVIRTEGSEVWRSTIHNDGDDAVYKVVSRCHENGGMKTDDDACRVVIVDRHAIDALQSPPRHVVRHPIGSL